MPGTTFDILEELESNPGMNVKRRILSANSHNFLLQQAFQVTLDPYLNYGVSKIKVPPAVPRTRCNEGIMIAFNGLLLGELSDRQLSGNAARSAIESIFAQANTVEQKWLMRILKRNLRCGVNKSLVNELWPRTVRGFDVALCDTLRCETAKFPASDAQKMNMKPGEIRALHAKRFVVNSGGETMTIDFSHKKNNLNFPVIVNPKLDGLRCVAVKRNGVVTLYTRNGNEIDSPGTKEIRRSLENADYDNIVLDGELLADGCWENSVTAAFKE